MNEDKKKKKQQQEDSKKQVSLDELEKMSGGAGLRGATTSKTHDMPDGMTK